MKNLKYGITLASLLLVTTGCFGGEAKTLKCKTNDESLGKQEVTIDFADNGDVLNMGMRMFMDYGVELSKEDLAPVCDEFKEQGVTCDIKTEGTKVEVDVVYDFEKVTEEVKEEVVGNGQNYASVKKDFESMDYTCE